MGWLDKEAPKLTGRIPASNTNDQKEDNENLAKPVTNANLKTPGSLVHARAGGSPCDLNREAIRLSDKLLHQGKDKKAETKTINISTTAVPTVLRAPEKSILKSPVADRIGEEKVPKPARKETSAYRPSEKVSQFDACPHKVEEVKPAVDEKHVVEGSKQTHLLNKSRPGENTQFSDRSKAAETKKSAEMDKSSVSINPAETYKTIYPNKPAEPAATIMPAETVKPAVLIKPAQPNKPNTSPADNTKYSGTQGTTSTFQQPAVFHPAQPATFSKSTPKLEVKIVVSPLSPTLKRNEVVEKPREEIKSVFSQWSAKSSTSKSENDKKTSSSLKSDLDVLDSQHSKNMKSIDSNFEKASDKQSRSMVTPSVSTSGLAPASSPLVSQPEKLEKKEEVVEKPKDNIPGVFSQLSGKSLSSECEADKKTSSLLKSELEVLDSQHSKNMQSIDSNFEKASDKQSRSMVTPSVSISILAPASSSIVSQQDKLEKKDKVMEKPKDNIPSVFTQFSGKLSNNKCETDEKISSSWKSGLKILDSLHSKNMQSLDSNFEKASDRQFRSMVIPSVSTSNPEPAQLVSKSMKLEKKKEVVEKPKDNIPSVFAQFSGNSTTSKCEIDKKISSSLKSELEVLESQHSKNMQSIDSNFEKASGRQSRSMVTPTVSTSRPAPVSSSQSVSHQEKSQKKQQEIPSTQSPYTVNGNQANKLFPETKATTYMLKTDLKKIDDAHVTHMKEIEINFKDQDIKSRQPPSTDHRDRPSTLGRSRFESPNFRKDATIAADSLRTQYVMEHHVPRRNQTVHDVANLASLSNSPEPALLTISKTATIETRQQSPEVQSTSWRQKFEQNFQPSLEPNPVSKPSSNVHLSKPSVTSFKYPSSTNPPMSPTISRSTYSDRQIPSKTSFVDKSPRISSNDRTYTPSSNFERSQTDVNLTTSRNFLPPSRLSTSSYATPAHSTSTSNSHLSPSPTSYGTGGYNTSNSYSSSTYSPTSSYTLSPSLSLSFPSPAVTFTPTIASTYSSSTSYTPSSTLERSRTDIDITTYKNSGDLQSRIQATKDQHKLDIKKAMSFDQISVKPPVVAKKLPRPDPGKYASISTISSALDKRETRRMDKALGDRSTRGRTEDLLAKTASYRL